MSSITVLPLGKSFEAGPDQTVLAAAIAADVGMPYSCRDGSCRTCICKAVKGYVTYSRAPAGLSKQEQAEGWLLPCMAIARSDMTLDAPEAAALAAPAPIRVPARVLSIDKPAPDVARVTVAIPARQEFRFLAGQYMDVLLSDGARRSYSVASTPDQLGELEFHIRHLPGGRFTDRVFQTLKPRDMLQLEGPYGSFYLRDQNQAIKEPTVFVVSGTGFAPVKAMVNDLIARGQSRAMALYWGGRRPLDIYGADLVRGWQERVTGFQFVPVISEALRQDDWTGRTGLVHEAVMEDFSDMSALQIYACGAPAMVEAARCDFQARRGMNLRQFYADAFYNQAQVGATAERP